MAEILSTKLKNDTVRLFYDDIQNNDFYVFVSSIVSEPLQRRTVKNSQYDKNLFLEKTLFGKKILPSDVKFMIKYYPWQKDEVYVQYDDRENMEDQRFYAVVGPNNNSTGDYRVYKCLSNNDGLPSIVPPNYEAGPNQVYKLPDGYVWQFMYVISKPQFEAYNAIGYIPLVGDFEVDPTVVTSSSVSDIFVENYIDNNGYPTLKSAITVGNGRSDGTIFISSTLLSKIANYYSGMTMYITSGSVSFVYEIDSYSYDETSGLGQVKVIGNPSPSGDNVLNGYSVEIIPTIKIEGDGTGAIAIARMTDQRISSVEIRNAGSGYHNIQASIVDPVYDFNPDDPLSIDVRAQLRAILSPPGGHNYNLIDEMHCRHILLYGYITETDNNRIGATNTYSQIGIVKNPEFTPDVETGNTAYPDVFDNRIAVITDSYDSAVINGLVKQINSSNETVFEAKVHDIDATSNTVYLSEYLGPYVNTANNDTSFDLSLPLRNETGQVIQINTPVANNVIESRYTQRTGTVYFMEDFFPLTRAKTSREEYKLVLEF